MKGFVSTSAIAKKLEVEAIDLFLFLEKNKWIKGENKKWHLTDAGIELGGKLAQSKKFGTYIIWPQDKMIEKIFKTNLITASAIKESFHNITRNRINLVLSELGWMEKMKDNQGWTVTPLGKTVGGRQYKHSVDGKVYVKWPEIILKNKNLIEALKDVKVVDEKPEDNKASKKIPHISEQENKELCDIFRKQFPAETRTKDGHYVRSKAELIIDNALYDYGLVHAYEKKVPVEEHLFSDFYLPSQKVYIEYWGLENSPEYSKRKEKKKELYKKYKLNLIELDDNDIQNLDDHLPQKLLKFGIKVF